MIKALLKKQIMEVFSWVYFDRKNGKNRSKNGIIGYAALYLLIFGFLGVFFYQIANMLCKPLSDAGFIIISVELHFPVRCFFRDDTAVLTQAANPKMPDAAKAERIQAFVTIVSESIFSHVVPPDGSMNSFTESDNNQTERNTMPADRTAAIHAAAFTAFFLSETGKRMTKAIPDTTAIKANSAVLTICEITSERHSL